MPTQPSKTLETVPNPHPDREYEVEMTCPEFTCVCPMTGQPDFATYKITYAPGPRLVELKSLKLYLWSYRDEGAFHEDVTNRILNDLVEACAPRRMTVVGEYLPEAASPRWSARATPRRETWPSASSRPGGAASDGCARQRATEITLVSCSGSTGGAVVTRAMPSPSTRSRSAEGSSPSPSSVTSRSRIENGVVRDCAA